jgi:hypothetical protein
MHSVRKDGKEAMLRDVLLKIRVFMEYSNKNVVQLMQRKLSICVISRFYRVLTMVYNTQNYWGFGLCPSPGFQLMRRKRKIRRFGNWICFRPQVKGQSRCLLSPEEGNRSSFRNVFFFLFWLIGIRKMDEVRKPSNSVNMRYITLTMLFMILIFI